MDFQLELGNDWMKCTKYVQCWYYRAQGPWFSGEPTMNDRVSKVVADHDDLLTHWRYI